MIYLMDVEAPRVARHCQPGQFVIVKMDEKGERIPLTICDYDREAGTITIVFQTVGASTTKMAELKAGDDFRDFTGPLGRPSEFVEEDLESLKNKKILFVGGGVGAAPVYPQVKWMKEHGIDVDVIIGSKTKDLLILEDEMRAVAGNYYPCTDDGTYGHSGMVTTKIEKLVEEGNHYDLCVAIGPMIMMKFTCLLTKKLEIPTIVSMNRSWWTARECAAPVGFTWAMRSNLPVWTDLNLTAICQLRRGNEETADVQDRRGTCDAEITRRRHPSRRMWPLRR